MILNMILFETATNYVIPLSYIKENGRSPEWRVFPRSENNTILMTMSYLEKRLNKLRAQKEIRFSIQKQINITTPDNPFFYLEDLTGFYTHTTGEEIKLSFIYEDELEQFDHMESVENNQDFWGQVIKNAENPHVDITMFCKKDIRMTFTGSRDFAYKTVFQNPKTNGYLKFNENLSIKNPLRGLENVPEVPGIYSASDFSSFYTCHPEEFLEKKLWDYQKSCITSKEFGITTAIVPNTFLQGFNVPLNKPIYNHIAKDKTTRQYIEVIETAFSNVSSISKRIRCLDWANNKLNVLNNALLAYDNNISKAMEVFSADEMEEEMMLVFRWNKGLISNTDFFQKIDKLF